jgi:hypothetical protein
LPYSILKQTLPAVLDGRRSAGNDPHADIGADKILHLRQPKEDNPRWVAGNAPAMERPALLKSCARCSWRPGDLRVMFPMTTLSIQPRKDW